jgi:hypothetical protein
VEDYEDLEPRLTRVYLSREEYGPIAEFVRDEDHWVVVEDVLEDEGFDPAADEGPRRRPLAGPLRAAVTAELSEEHKRVSYQTEGQATAEEFLDWVRTSLPGGLHEVTINGHAFDLG